MTAQSSSPSPDVGSDSDDLRERISYLAEGNSGPIVTIIGSGMSLGSVPGTKEMTNRFLDELSPTVRDGISERWSKEISLADRYQQAAQAVGRQRGDKALNDIIRSSVLEACEDPRAKDPSTLTSREVMRQLTAEAKWRLTDAHRGFAEFYARLPAAVQGPILTTNFDPLIEVALRAAGVTADPLPITFDDPPTLAHLENSSVRHVLHIHGYFVETWSINSLQQLAAARLNLENLLSSLFAGSTVLVLGYGGWEDSFMRVLQRHAEQRTILNAEVVWCAHSGEKRKTLENPILRQLSSAPGFQLYSGIDASILFDARLGMRAAKSLAAAPRGWTLLPVANAHVRPPVAFSDGAAPAWSDALPGHWPLLSATTTFTRSVFSRIDGRLDGGVAAIGPLGEGKSMALRQTAMLVAKDRPEWKVLWREQGAPRLSTEWLAETRDALGDVVFCIDEADLAEADIEALLDNASAREGRTVVLLACQDRIWWTLAARRREEVETVVFDGLSDADADALASRWDELGVGVDKRGTHGREKLDVAEVSSALQEAAHAGSAGRRSTLFGAILEVRESETLAQRVDEMMEKLSQIRVRQNSDLTLADVYGTICVLQVFADRDRSNSRGATQSLIAQIVNADDSLENVAVLRALGKEASITYAGRRVFSRHPRIAEAAVAWLRRKEKLEAICALAGRAGGQLRQSGNVERLEYSDAYLLGRSIDEYGPAAAACVGAIEGAKELLEPRITYLSVARKFDLPKAEKYAHAIVDLITSMKDRKYAIRVFLNELALIDLAENRYRRALGLVGLMLHNGSGAQASIEQVEYALGTMARSYNFLVRQNPSEFTLGAQLMRRVAGELLSALNYAKYVSKSIVNVPASVEIERLPLHTALERLSNEISSSSKMAVQELALPYGQGFAAEGKFTLRHRIDLSDLQFLRP